MFTSSIISTRLVGVAVFFAFFVSLFAFVQPTFAAAYAAEIVSVTDDGVITMAPGEKVTVDVSFKNTGTETWKNDGPGFVSLYTHGPKYRRSVFDPGTWIWGDQLKRIEQASVVPGAIATMSFELHAPDKVGEYQEVFWLASENKAWIGGAELKLAITVSEDATAEVPTDDADASSALSAEVAMRSANQVKVVAGKPVLFTVAFTNTGKTTWNEFGLYEDDLRVANAVTSFRHLSWSGSRVGLGEGAVKPGEVGVVQFAFTAPATNGSHAAVFALKANGELVEGGEIRIPVDVTGGSGEAAQAPIRDDEEVAEAIDESQIVEQPVLRVGVLIVDEETDDEVVITSEESAFTVTDLSGAVLAEVKKGKKVTAHYRNGVYFYEVDGEMKQTTSGLRFVPEVDHAVMKVTNFDRRATRGHIHAFNEFRNVLELRYSESKDRLWLINELQIEYYLRGLGETSNNDDHEYQKSMITAARSFAFYHWTRNTKRVKDHVHLVSWSEDQVYNGYEQERRSPTIVKAVEETRGMAIMYQGDVALASYFARSNGKTKDWNQVWSGNIPYIKSVEVACDKGKTQWGHGVGMPASGALCMAKDGKKFDEILMYFYQGVDLVKKWR